VGKLVLFNAKMPAYLYNGVVEVVRKGLATNTSEFIRHAVNDMLISGTYPSPPPLSGSLVHVSFHLTEWAMRRLKELVDRGVYSSVAEAVRAAIYQALGKPKAVEVAPTATPQRRKIREESKEETVEEGGDVWKPDGKLIIPTTELRLTEKEWYKAAPCITTLIIRETWEKYYIVDVECAKRRGVEI